MTSTRRGRQECRLNLPTTISNIVSATLILQEAVPLDTTPAERESDIGAVDDGLTAATSNVVGCARIDTRIDTIGDDRREIGDIPTVDAISTCWPVGIA